MSQPVCWFFAFCFSQRWWPSGRRPSEQVKVSDFEILSFKSLISFVDSTLEARGEKWLESWGGGERDSSQNYPGMNAKGSLWWEIDMIYVMAWCCQATGHFLNQYWPRSRPCGNCRPQWVRWWYTVIQILMNITISIRIHGIKASNVIELLQRWFRLNWFMELELHLVSLDRKQWACCHVQEAG